jgi:tRNA-2-methylthio-N6-dimethylallyladenosine synthase
VTRLAAEGHKQVTLLGQNVNSYRHEGADFATLMRRVASVPGIARVRFTSPHPKDFPEPLLQAIADEEHLCAHVHLPLQAGSDRVLQKMNRGYTAAEFTDLAEQIRTIIPGVALTTDIICGFPTETDAEYAETERLVREIQFDSAFIFKYSEREGTIAKKLWDDDVPEQAKSERVTRLVALQREISLAKHQAMVGQDIQVLIEGTSRKNDQEWKARSEGNAVVVFADTKRQIGDFCTVRVTEATPNTLLAIPVD